jgi:hypothetical protein
MAMAVAVVQGVLLKVPYFGVGGQNQYLEI